MPHRHHVVLIAKERPYDEAQWRRLLTAFVYVLHERRAAQSSQRRADSAGGTPCSTC